MSHPLLWWPQGGRGQRPGACPSSPAGKGSYSAERGQCLVHAVSGAAVRAGAGLPGALTPTGETLGPCACRLTDGSCKPQTRPCAAPTRAGRPFGQGPGPAASQLPTSAPRLQATATRGRGGGGGRPSSRRGQGRGRISGPTPGPRGAAGLGVAVRLAHGAFSHGAAVQGSFLSPPGVA